MAAETHINVGFRDALLRVSGWNPSDVAADDQAAGVSFYGRRIKPDVLLTLPSHPPLLVECKVHSSSGDPLKDVSEKLGAAPLSPDAPRAAGETVRRGIAVRYPPGAEEWVACSGRLTGRYRHQDGHGGLSEHNQAQTDQSRPVVPVRPVSDGLTACSDVSQNSRTLDSRPVRKGMNK